MLASHIFGAFLLITSSLANPVSFRAKKGVDLVLDDLEVALNKSVKISSDAGTLDSNPSMWDKVYEEVDSLFYHFKDTEKNLGDNKFKGKDETKVFEAFELVSHALQGNVDILTYQQPVIEKHKECGLFIGNMHHTILQYLRYSDPLIDLFDNKEYVKDAEELVGDVTTQETEFYGNVKCTASRQRYSHIWEMAMSILGVFVH